MKRRNNYYCLWIDLFKLIAIGLVTNLHKVNSNIICDYYFLIFWFNFSSSNYDLGWYWVYIRALLCIYVFLNQLYIFNKLRAYTKCKINIIKYRNCVSVTRIRVKLKVDKDGRLLMVIEIMELRVLYCTVLYMITIK